MKDCILFSLKYGKSQVSVDIPQKNLLGIIMSNKCLVIKEKPVIDAKLREVMSTPIGTPPLRDIEFYKVATDYQLIETNHAFVDAITMWFVKNPQDFGVVVAPNLFGDIISDLAAAITGGLGFAEGANINPSGVSMFEPIHGSGPKYTGMNIVNPIVAIASGAMMLESMGEFSAAERIYSEINYMLANEIVRTRDMGEYNYDLRGWRCNCRTYPQDNQELNIMRVV